MSDLEKLINASDLIEWIIETDPDWCVGSVRCIIDHIDKMPSAQPESEPIDPNERDIEILSALRSNYCCFDEKEERVYHALSEAIKAINALEQSEPHWIPVTERLPEMDDRVLVYTTGHEYHVWDAMPNRGENYAWEDEEGLYHNLYEADLWLPLPEPYGGEQE